jgi:hypothetical protein
VRQVLAEARPREDAETQARRAFQQFEFNSVVPIYAEQTPRARAEREIGRIATWYQLPGEVTRALDRAGVTVVSGLDDEALDQLLGRMRRLEDCIQNGGDAPDAPAAR